MANRYFEILDFINMHYCLTRRTDTAFWREIRQPERINDRLRAKLDYWRIKPPTALDFEDQFFGFVGEFVEIDGDGNHLVPVGRLDDFAGVGDVVDSGGCLQAKPGQ